MTSNKFTQCWLFNSLLFPSFIKSIPFVKILVFQVIGIILLPVTQLNLLYTAISLILFCAIGFLFMRSKSLFIMRIGRQIKSIFLLSMISFISMFISEFKSQNSKIDNSLLTDKHDALLKISNIRRHSGFDEVIGDVIFSETIPGKTRLLLTLDDNKSMNLQKDQHYWVRGELRRIVNSPLPGDFDKESYYSNQSIFYSLISSRIFLLNDRSSWKSEGNQSLKRIQNKLVSE